MSLVNCPECHKEINDEENYCPNCGYAIKPKNDNGSNKIENSNLIEEQFQAIDTIEQKISNNDTKPKSFFAKSLNWIKKDKKHIAFTIVIIIGFLFLCIGVPIIVTTQTQKEEQLVGDDLLAYNLIVEVSYKFKNPSSVRILSGTVVYDEDDMETSGWFVISATNGFGARTTSSYFVGHIDGNVFALDEEDATGSTSYYFDHSTSFFTDTDSLNIEKINEALDKKWESFN